MRKQADMLFKACKGIDNVSIEEYCCDPENNYSSRIDIRINGVVVSLYTDPDDEYICGATVERCL